jgi:hypothetical protein
MERIDDGTVAAIGGGIGGGVGAGAASVSPNFGALTVGLVAGVGAATAIASYYILSKIQYEFAEGNQ